MGVGLFLTPGAWLAGFIKRTTILYYTKYESSGLCGFGDPSYIATHKKGTSRQ